MAPGCMISRRWAGLGDVLVRLLDGMDGMGSNCIGCINMVDGIKSLEGFCTA